MTFGRTSTIVHKHGHDYNGTMKNLGSQLFVILNAASSSCTQIVILLISSQLHNRFRMES